MAQDKLERPLQVVKLPDLSKMTDAEIDEYAKSLWEKVAGQSSSDSPQDSDPS